MMTLSPSFRLDAHDAVFAARTPPREWARLRALRDQPNFLRALAAYGDLMPVYFSDNIALNKVVTEAWRFEILVYLLYLHDTRDPADPRSGLTVSNLQKLCARQNCASKGRVLAILGIMSLARYIVRRKSDLDSRVTTIEPSPAFVAIVEGWNQRIFRIIDAAEPEGRLAELHGAHPRFGAEMRTRGALGLIDGFKVLDPFPEVNHFVGRDGGWMLLLTLVARALAEGEGRAIAPVSLDLGVFAPRFGVSRSHLRRVLESAHAEGLLTAPPRNGTDIRLADHLVCAFLSCMASELSFYREKALEAAVDLGLR